MASKYLQKYPIPSSFPEILSDFAREVLRDQPTNIIEYASQYFEALEKGTSIKSNSKYNVPKSTKKYQLNYEVQKAEDIVKKAKNVLKNMNSVETPVIPTQKTVTTSQVENYFQQLQNKLADGSVKEIKASLRKAVDAAFARYDQNQSGSLNRNQLNAFFHEVIAEMSDLDESESTQLIEALLNEGDTDQNGLITKQELISYIERVASIE